MTERRTCKDCLHYAVCGYHITEETNMTIHECSHGFKDSQAQEIRVPVQGGYLVASRNPDPNYDGIVVFFEAYNGLCIDVALVESKQEEERKNIDVYCYEDATTEDWTKKFTLKTEEMVELLDD